MCSAPTRSPRDDRRRRDVRQSRTGAAGIGRAVATHLPNRVRLFEHPQARHRRGQEADRGYPERDSEPSQEGNWGDPRLRIRHRAPTPARGPGARTGAPRRLDVAYEGLASLSHSRGQPDHPDATVPRRPPHSSTQPEADVALRGDRPGEARVADLVTRLGARDRPIDRGRGGPVGTTENARDTPSRACYRGKMKASRA
jgi:hypothetical protein